MCPATTRRPCMSSTPEPSLESAVPSLADIDYTEAEKDPEFVVVLPNFRFQSELGM